MARLFLELWGSFPRLMQGMDMRSITTAGKPRIEPVIIRARVVWMYAIEAEKESYVRNVYGIKNNAVFFYNQLMNQ